MCGWKKTCQFLTNGWFNRTGRILRWYGTSVCCSYKYCFFFYFNNLIEILLVGQPTCYGHAEPWKLTKEIIGRTKVSRAPENQSRHPKNDGRKFDTEKELLGKPSKKRNPSNSKSKTKKPPPVKKKPRRKGRKSAPKDSDSYEPDGDDEDDTPLKGSAAADTDGSVPDVETHTPMNTTQTNPDSRNGELPNTVSVYTLGTKWDNNSCWLDTSLQALYASVVHDASFQL